MKMKDIAIADDSDEDKRIMRMTWSRMEKQHLTDGFREGALTGKDEHFQSSFDRGYKDGYQKSYDIGLKHGASKASEFLKKLQNQTKYNCDRNLHKQLCSTCNETSDTNKT